MPASQDAREFLAEFDCMEWQPLSPGVRVQQFISNGTRMRRLKITPEMSHPEWCEAGHAGFVLEGELELRFDDQTIQVKAGNGFVLPAGSASRHIPRSLAPTTVLLLVEAAGN